MVRQRVLGQANAHPVHDSEGRRAPPQGVINGDEKRHFQVCQIGEKARDIHLEQDGGQRNSDEGDPPEFGGLGSAGRFAESSGEVAHGRGWFTGGVTGGAAAGRAPGSGTLLSGILLKSCAPRPRSPKTCFWSSPRRRVRSTSRSRSV